NLLWFRSLAPRICSHSFDFRPVPRPRRVWKSGGGRLAAIVPKHEFIKEDLKLALAHAVICADDRAFSSFRNDISYDRPLISLRIKAIIMRKRPIQPKSLVSASGLRSYCVPEIANGRPIAISALNES